MDGSPQNLILSTKSPLFVDESQKNPMSSTKNAGFVDGVNFFTERRMSELADDSAGISDCDRVGRDIPGGLIKG